MILCINKLSKLGLERLGIVPSPLPEAGGLTGCTSQKYSLTIVSLVLLLRLTHAKRVKHG